MNSKKILAMLLGSLGAFSIVLTGCGNNNKSEEPAKSEEPVVTSESTPAISEDQPSEVQPSEEQPSEEQPSEVEPSSEAEPSSEPEPELPDTLTYDVTFNYDDAENALTVWTAKDVKKTVAPQAIGNSFKDVSAYKTCPLTVAGLDVGMYYFVVDANGFIEYASYGLGCGYGSPCDGYYWRSETKDRGNQDYWVLADDYGDWPAKAMIGGKEYNAWTLYDFVIPEDGFVVKGHADESHFKELWYQITGQYSAPKSTNQTLEGTIKPGELDKFYLTIDENYQLAVRERLESEYQDEWGEMEDETPAYSVELTDADACIEYTGIDAVAALEDNALAKDVKGVVTYLKARNAVIEDENGNAVLLYGDTIADETLALQVGDTIVVDGTKKMYYGKLELDTLTRVEKIVGYGEVPAVSPIAVTAENISETWVAANSLKQLVLVKAEVLEIKPTGNSKVKIGDTEMIVYKSTFPENVAVGDFVDIVGSMQPYNDTLELCVDSVDDIHRYYNVYFDADGDASTALESVAGATGDSVTLTAVAPSSNFTFVKWVKVVGETEEDAGNTVEISVTIGEEDVTYKALFDYAPWLALSDEYGQVFTLTGAVNTGDTALSVFVSSDALNDATNASNANKWTGNGWRTFFIFDGNGKVCLASYNAAYCGLTPVSNWYGHNVIYSNATPEANPAFVLGENYSTDNTDWEFAVPENGFALSMHTNNIDEILAVFGLEKTYINDSQVADHSKLDSVRAFYDAANNTVRFYDEIVGEGQYVSEATVYTSDNTDIALGDYTLAIDENGLVRFASCTKDGYGGPSDGFYHDGSYVLTAGQQCGIFNVDENFAGWPATVTIGDETVNAWTLYSIACPEGWTIFTGNVSQMLPVINAAFDLNEAGLDNNSLLEGLTDGAYNGNKVSVKYNSAGKAIYSVDYAIPEGKAELPGHVYTSADSNIALGDYTIAFDEKGLIKFASCTKDGYGGPSDGFYHDGSYVLTAGQQCGIFNVDENFAGWPATVTIGDETVNAWTLYSIACPEGWTIVTGSADELLPMITAAFGITSLDNNAELEGLEDGSANGKVVSVENFHGKQIYSVVDYVAPTAKFAVAVANVSQELAWDEVSSSFAGSFDTATWNTVQFTYTTSEGVATHLSHSTATITGSIKASGDECGADWTSNLYCDDAEGAANGLYYTCTGGTYSVTYDPATNTLNIVGPAAE